MPVVSPVSERLTVVGLLLLTFATGLVDAISVLVLGHVFVANMTGNVIFLGFWFVPHSGVDLTAALVAFGGFVLGHRHRWPVRAAPRRARLVPGCSRRSVWRSSSWWCCRSWPAPGVLDYRDNTKLILIAGLAITFGAQNATARMFGIQELSTTVLTSTIVGIGFDSRLAGGTGHREKLRYSVVLTMCGGSGRRRDDVALHGRSGDRVGGGRGRGERADLPVRAAGPDSAQD